jgi:predicted Ser/Thr protein kinase
MNQNANSLGIFTESITHVACPSCNAELDVSDFRVFEEIVCPSCQEKFQVPGRLGGFILIEELGRGAMGCVYLAMDESLQRLVALKVIRKEYGEDPKMLETVQREAQAMATLNHRNIVQVYSFGRVKEQPYFVMELLEGERLDEMMEGGQQISEIRALEIALDVASGLDAANQAGLTHGDIKPANILMNDHGVAKVVDFGLAKFMEPGAEIEVWGTPYYIAPEKARKKGEDSRSDQYSLGGTLFHALAGQPPFDGPNPTKVVVAALKEDTPDLRQFNEGVTEKTAAVIRRMMDKNPNRRYPTYASLLADLNLALIEAKGAEEARVKAEALRQAKHNKKMNPIIPIIIIITLLVCVGIGVVVWKQSQGPSKVEVAKYEGPERFLEAPFTRVEIRNLTEAVKAVKDKNLTLAIQKVETAERLIPPQHAAMAWAKFIEAGIYFYAQYPDLAKNVLDEAVAIEDLIFDADKRPPEDPQLLARYALGQAEDKELDKALRKAAPYYGHLAEVARGYRYLLNNQANQSARHFKYYGEMRVQGMDWPYILQPLASLLHVPLEKLLYEEEKQEILQEKADEMLSGLGIRTSEGYPLFSISTVNANGGVNLKNTKNASWKTQDGYAFSTVPGDTVLVKASGLQMLPGRAFTVLSRIKTATVAERKAGESDVLFHFGGFTDISAPAPGAKVPVNGLVVEIPPVVVGKGSLRVRIGNGKEDLLVQSFPSEHIQLGAFQAYAVSWDSYREDGSKPTNQMMLSVDGKQIGTLTIPPDLLAPHSTGLNLVSIGRGIGRGVVVGWGGDFTQVSTTIIFSSALQPSVLPAVIADLL